MTRPINFGAGPSALPESVLKEAANGLLDFEGTGIGIAEISHRSKQFTAFVKKTETLIRTQLNVPSTHEILFTQGGGTGQFSAVVYNFLARHRLLHPDDGEPVLDYVVTGSWSKKASEEARRLVGGSRVHIAGDGRREGKTFTRIPGHSEYSFSPNAALIYYCENETVDGVQFSHDPSAPASFPFDRLPTTAALLPLVADYSSSFMSRPIPRLADHALIFAGAQKNIGPAGLTILIVRQDCLVDVDAAAALGAPPVPISMAYNVIADAASLYNTPSVLALYISGLVLDRSLNLGGVQYYEQLNRRKADKVYAALRDGEARAIFRPKVEHGSRSWMNVVFDVLGDGAEARFIAGAEQLNMKALKGHRSVGGIRVSLYNAITEEQTDRLVAYIRQFT
ncbi:phosphoserine aminotransferase [Guyanagaster necrorhizus]|uniref:phosphoserine transaminase n=1 Tax=Guyanagaster necrorhizus TaxID=856835 RepID=A0A9P7W4S5_9AGAR|nr:phosphoserine aminotransferase [Guyanagaster necrorhizus MCA 3950]KAG7452627.1 phosphoserine aminotransferase [Guyanagaster necrorhizus MCA 3950]